MLTIGILSFNRANALRRLLESCVVIPNDLVREVIVCDDCSAFDVHELCNEFSDKLNTRVVRHSTNRGYARNYLSLFAHCRTEWLMIVADDDLVDPDQVGRLTRTLSGSSSCFISSVYNRNGNLIRAFGAKGTIEVSQVFSAAAHASGLVYKLRDVSDALEALTPSIEQGHLFSNTYPQVALLCLLKMNILTTQLCTYSGLAPVIEGDNYPTGIRLTDELPYNSFKPRILQASSFYEFIKEHAGDEVIRDFEFLIEKNYLRELLRSGSHRNQEASILYALSKMDLLSCLGLFLRSSFERVRRLW